MSFRFWLPICGEIVVAIWYPDGSGGRLLFGVFADGFETEETF